MRLLRGLGGALLWIAASLLGLVGAIMCVTVVLLPLGIPLLGVARRMFTSAVRLMLPRALAHPGKEMKSSLPDMPKTDKPKKLAKASRKALKKKRKRRRKRLQAIGIDW